MQYVKDNRGVTLVELLITLTIGSMFVGIIFLVTSVFQEQNDYNESYNTAKNKVLLITNTLIERLEKAERVEIDETSNTITLIHGAEKEKVKFLQNSGLNHYLYEVSYTDSSGNSRSLGTVGYHLETPYSDTFFILTLWAPYKQTNSTEGKFIVTQGFHTSVVNQR
jgi:prepilin-type N-terminal cleavage/methylation domain-containing protein